MTGRRNHWKDEANHQRAVAQALRERFVDCQNKYREIFLQLGGIQACIAEELDLDRTPTTEEEIRPILRKLKEKNTRVLHVLRFIRNLFPYIESGYKNIKNDAAARTINEMKIFVDKILNEK